MKGLHSPTDEQAFELFRELRWRRPDLDLRSQGREPARRDEAGGCLRHQGLDDLRRRGERLRSYGVTAIVKNATLISLVFFIFL